MFDRILVPLDGSVQAESALAVTRHLHPRLVYLLQVERDGADVFHQGDPYLCRLADDLQGHGREVETLRISGDPAERIIETAVDVDCIVMTTHGRGSAERLLHSSIANRVVQRAPAPVLLVPWDTAPSEVEIRRVLVPLDGSPLAETSLSPAIAMARSQQVGLHVVTVIQAHSSPLPAGDRLSASIAADYHKDVHRRHGHIVPVTTEVQPGDPVSVLRSAIRPHDLVVMTTHAYRGLRRVRHGSVADGVIHGATVPILVSRASHFTY